MQNMYDMRVENWNYDVSGQKRLLNKQFFGTINLQ